jgi:uncharacterized protein
MPVLDREKALMLLQTNNTPKNVIEHCIAVSVLAVEIAKRAGESGLEADIQFVETAALLHDIGRSKTQGVVHGIAGAALLKDYPRHARVCETHIGGGISKDEASCLGLPPKDYLPETLEERIICYADKLLHGTRRASMEETIEKFSGRLGPGHPTIARIIRLDEELRGLIR